MTGAKLSKEVTKRGRDIAACDVVIDTGKSRKSIAEVIYDEENKYIILIPEARTHLGYGQRTEFMARRNYESP